MTTLTHPFIRLLSGVLLGIAVATTAIAAPGPKTKIVSQPPAKLDLDAGESLALSVTATVADGSAPAYQWYAGKAIIPGATGATHLVTCEGNYHAVANGHAKSRPTEVTLNLAPSALPADRSILCQIKGTEQVNDTIFGSYSLVLDEPAEIYIIDGHRLEFYIRGGLRGEYTYDYKRVSPKKAKLTFSFSRVNGIYTADEKIVGTLDFSGYENGVLLGSLAGSLSGEEIYPYEDETGVLQQGFVSYLGKFTGPLTLVK